MKVKSPVVITHIFLGGMVAYCILQSGCSVSQENSKRYETTRANFLLDTNFVTVSAVAGTHGSVTPSGNVPVHKNGRIDFFFNPDPGFQLDSLIVDGTVQGTTTRYAFENVSVKHNIRATFSNK